MKNLDVDLSSPAFKQNPYHTLAELRERGPVVRATLPFVGATWLTTTYEATIRVLREKDTFVNDPRNAGKKNYAGVQWWMPKFIRAMASNMLGKDEPDHRRLRSLVEAAFLRSSIEEMRPRIEQLVEKQLDLLEEASRSTGTVDLNKHFSRPLPLAVICELLGLPDQDREKFLRWCEFTTAGNAWGMLKAFRGMGKMVRYLRQQFEECRRNPRPGMISALVAVEQEGERLNEEELLASAFILLIAGHETTVHLLNGGVMTFLEHPQQRAEMLADPSQTDAAVDEVLRYFTPVQMTKPRYVAHDIEFLGAHVKRGEYFMPLLAAANVDPIEFPEPERFYINRHPNHHVAFGTGIHVCLGLKLAKAEASIAFQQLFTRFPKLKLSVPTTLLPWTNRIGMRSVSSLPVALESQLQDNEQSAA